MTEKYDITDYLKDDKELQKAVVEEFLKENAELKAENERLKLKTEELENRMRTLDDEDITVEITEDEFEEYKQLKAENARLKEEIKKLEDFIKSDGEIDHINHEYTYKLRTCLQEIKEIAEKPKPFKDFSEIKSATEVGYDYAAICNELELRLHKVLELIIKAESEG